MGLPPGKLSPGLILPLPTIDIIDVVDIPPLELPVDISVSDLPVLGSVRSRQNSDDNSENYLALLGVDYIRTFDNDESSSFKQYPEYESRLQDHYNDSDNSGSISSRKDKPADKKLAIVLRSLGPFAKENITPQQLRILINMKDLLTKGVEVLKHGRGGKPKKRILYCKSDFTSLLWGENIDLKNENEKNENEKNYEKGIVKSPEKKNNSESFFRQLIGPANGPKSRLISRAGTFKTQDDRTILLSEVIEVRDDIGTDVMRRSVAKQFVAGSEQTCVISIILANRTLDFEIEEQYWRPIFHALQILVNYYRVILPSVHEQQQRSDRSLIESDRLNESDRTLSGSDRTINRDIEL
jgi:hypothetical protein